MPSENIQFPSSHTAIRVDELTCEELYLRLSGGFDEILIDPIVSE